MILLDHKTKQKNVTKFTTSINQFIRKICDFYLRQTIKQPDKNDHQYIFLYIYLFLDK